MSDTAAWSTKATPLACGAGAVMLALGVFSIVHAAVGFALRGAAWNLPACLCLFLAALLVAVRLSRERGRATVTVRWHAQRACFRLADGRDLALTRVWRGAGWVTLGLRPYAPAGRALQLVIWKSAMPAPLWNELLLRLQSDSARGNSHQNKESP